VIKSVEGSFLQHDGAQLSELVLRAGTATICRPGIARPGTTEWTWESSRELQGF